LDIDIINMRFEYSDTDTVSDVEYPTRILNIRTRIRTDLNPFKRIRSRIRSENIRTVFIRISDELCSNFESCIEIPSSEQVRARAQAVVMSSIFRLMVVCDMC